MFRTMTEENLIFLADRWGEPIEKMSPRAEKAEKADYVWIEALNNILQYVHLAKPGMVFCTEQVFAVREKAAGGRRGALIEFEFDDGFVPSAGQIERLAAAAHPTAEVCYVPPGTDFVFNGRAAFRAFFPADLCTATAVETTAERWYLDLYP